MSKYLQAIWDDFAKQRDNYRSATLMPKSNENRHRKYVIREADVMETLNNASFENHQAILETLNLLAHQLGEYFSGLNYDVNCNGDEESANEDEESDEKNDENFEPTDELIRDIKRPIIRSPTSTINLELPGTLSQSQPTLFF
jgi:hypothetical protein